MKPEYDIVISPLSPEDGGGFVGFVPDLQGCMSDGETVEEAMANTLDAVEEWLSMNDRLGRPRPEPGWARRHAQERHEALTKTLDAMAEYVKTVDGEFGQKISELHAQLDEVLALLHALEKGDRGELHRLRHLSAFERDGSLKKRQDPNRH